MFTLNPFQGGFSSDWFQSRAFNAHQQLGLIFWLIFIVNKSILWAQRQVHNVKQSRIRDNDQEICFRSALLIQTKTSSRCSCILSVGVATYQEFKVCLKLTSHAFLSSFFHAELPSFEVKLIPLQPYYHIWDENFVFDIEAKQVCSQRACFRRQISR